MHSINGTFWLGIEQESKIGLGDRQPSLYLVSNTC